MKKSQKIITIIGGIALLITAGIVATILTVSEPAPVANQPGPTCPIVSIVDDVVTIKYTGVAGETALATLQSFCEVGLHPTYDGFVTTIAGHAAGDTHYWAFYINGDYATEGAGTYRAQEGDEITWVLTSLDAAF
jgi:hypothetical protein